MYPRIFATATGILLLGCSFACADLKFTQSGTVTGTEVAASKARNGYRSL